MTVPSVAPDSLFEFEPSPNIYLGEGYPCAAGISRGIYQRIDACPNNPDLYWRVESLGNIRFFAQHNIEHTTQQDYRINAQKSIVHTTAKDWQLSAATGISHTSQAAYQIAAKGALSLTSEQSFVTSAPVTLLESTQNLTLKVGDTRLELRPEGVFIHGDVSIDGGLTARWLDENPDL